MKIFNLESIQRLRSAWRMSDEAYQELKVNQNLLVQSEKLSSIGQMSAGVAHEINNPLSVILGEAEMLLEDKDKDEDTRDVSKIIIEQVERIKVITEALLEFSRKSEFKPELLDINGIVEKSISLLRYQVRIETIEIVEKLDLYLPHVFGDRNQIQQVFLNIMLNAIQVMEQGGKLTIRTHREKVTENGKRKTDRFKRGEEIVVIEFKDTGKGMDEKTLKKVFDPFFTTKEKNTGLGLSVSYGIIENHRGSIEADSKLGEGSTFVVALPVSIQQGGADNERKDFSNR